MRENCIEWYTGSDTVTVTLTQQRFINKVRKLAESHADVTILAENEDGSILAHLPLSFIKFSAPRQMSEEQRAEAAERLKSARNVTDNREVQQMLQQLDVELHIFLVCNTILRKEVRL